MEEKIFYRPEVLRELKRYVEVRLHVDAVDEKSKTLAKLKLERLDDASLPIYEIVDPDTGKALEVYKGADILSGGENFRAFLARHVR